MKLEIKPLKTEPKVALRFIEEITEKEDKQLTNFEKAFLSKTLNAAHDKYKKEEKQNHGNK